MAPRTYRVVVADPPWRFFNKATRAAAEGHYSTMAFDDVCSLPVHRICRPNSALFLWCPNSFLEGGIDVVKEWGFSYKLPITWCKVVKGTTRARIGLGNYFRNSTEQLLLGIRGKVKPEARNLPTWFMSPRGQHSVKPDEAYELVEAFSGGPYVELFARKRREGWDAWGDEVESDLPLSPQDW